MNGVIELVVERFEVPVKERGGRTGIDVTLLAIDVVDPAWLEVTSLGMYNDTEVEDEVDVSGDVLVELEVKVKLLVVADVDVEVVVLIDVLFERKVKVLVAEDVDVEGVILIDVLVDVEGGSMMEMVRVAPHSAKGVPSGQQPLSVQ